MSSPAVTVRPEDRIQDVVAVMAEHRLSGVVVAEDDVIHGIISESDLLLRVAHPQVPPLLSVLGSLIMTSGRKMDEQLRKMTAVSARELMTAPVYTVAADTPVQDLADLMVERNIRRVPVTDRGKLVGMVTRADILRKVLAANSLG